MAGQTLKARIPSGSTISEALAALSQIDAPGLTMERLVLEIQTLFERCQVSRGVVLVTVDQGRPHSWVAEPALPEETLSGLLRSLSRPIAGEVDVVALPHRFRVHGLGTTPRGFSVTLALCPGPLFRQARGPLLNLALSLLRMKVATLQRGPGDRARELGPQRLEKLIEIMRSLEPICHPADLATTVLDLLPSYLPCDVAGLLLDDRGRWLLSIRPVGRCSDDLVKTFGDEMLEEHWSQFAASRPPEPCEVRLTAAVPEHGEPKRSLGARLSLPIIARGGQILGRLVVGSAGDEAFGEQELVELSTLVSHLAFAFENRRQLCELERQAKLDGMTELYNYRTFRNLLTSEVSRATRYQKPMSLVLLDIDHFKQINDTFGHPRGDSVLKKVARLLLATKRQEDLVARYGGEEFAIILPETSLEGARLLAERIRRRVEQSRILKERPVTISLGVVAFDGQRQVTEDRIISRADVVLYQAKRAGRNCVMTAAQP